MENSVSSFYDLKSGNISYEDIMKEVNAFNGENGELSDKVGYTKRDIQIYRNIAKLLLERNSQNKTITRYEYFMLGGVDFGEASLIIYNLKCNNEIHKYEYSALKKFIHAQINIDSIRKYDFIMRTHYQFGDYVISDDEKKEIWNNLVGFISKKNIDDLVFSGAVRAYALDKGLIKGTKIHKKKR